MKQVKQSKMYTIKESDPTIFDERVNEFYSQGYEVVDKKWHDMQGDLCITFEFKEKVWEAESVKEEYELKGEQCYCGECHKLERSKDRRVKHHLCTKTHEMRKDTSCACNWYYCYLEGRRENGES